MAQQVYLEELHDECPLEAVQLCDGDKDGPEPHGGAASCIISNLGAQLGLTRAAMGHQAPDGIILVFGGADADGVAFSTSWLFDPAERTWTAVEPGEHDPAARSGATLTRVGNTAVLFGGVDFGQEREPEGVAAFDFATKAWMAVDVEDGGAAAPSPRNSHTATLLRDKERSLLLFIGGSSPQTGCAAAPAVLDVTALASGEGSTVRWTCLETGGEGPCPREMHSATLATIPSAAACDDVFAAAAQGKPVATYKREGGAREGAPAAEGAEGGKPVKVVCVMGGRAADGSLLDDVLLLRLDTLQWSCPYRTPMPLCSHAAVALGGADVAVWGGFSGAGPDAPASLFVLECDSLEWRETQFGSKPPAPRFAMSCVEAFPHQAAGDESPAAFIFGGALLTGQLQADVLALVPIVKGPPQEGATEPEPAS